MSLHTSTSSTLQCIYKPWAISICYCQHARISACRRFRTASSGLKIIEPELVRFIAKLLSRARNLDPNRKIKLFNSTGTSWRRELTFPLEALLVWHLAKHMNKPSLVLNPHSVPNRRSFLFRTIRQCSSLVYTSLSLVI